MLNLYKIVEPLVGCRCMVATNVDCENHLRDFIKTYKSAKDVNNDEGKTFLFFECEFDSEDSIFKLLELFGACVAYRPNDIFEVMKIGDGIVI